MATSTSPQCTLQRIATGIDGLDEVLGGGLFCGGIYMLSGEPGAGKTILGNQLCFNHIGTGGRALYVTLLTESHGRLIGALQPMTFFDVTQLGDKMQYVSGYQALEAGELAGLMQLLSKELRACAATMLVIDGLVSTSVATNSELVLKKFLHSLQLLVEMHSCTALLLTGTANGFTNYASRTMVDGLISLSSRPYSMRSVRELHVSKHRGSSHITGANVYDITDAGLVVYPRTEARVTLPTEPVDTVKSLPLGVQSLDNMLYGGLPAGSSTLLVGPPGSGKTLLQRRPIALIAQT